MIRITLKMDTFKKVFKMQNTGLEGVLLLKAHTRSFQG